MKCLPLDIIKLILSKLLWYDQLSIFQVCKKFNHINNDKYWLNQIKEDFPFDNTWFYHQNFYNYLACRARYLNSVLRIIRIYGGKIDDGFFVRDGNGTSLIIMVNKGLLQQLALIPKLYGF